MSYSIEITDAALAQIEDQLQFIAIECAAPLNAGIWLEAVWTVIDDLETMPSRHTFALENEFKPYEVRRALVGEYMILFTIEEVAQKVWVIGFRHGSRLPRPDELPDTPPGS